MTPTIPRSLALLLLGLLALVIAGCDSDDEDKDPFGPTGEPLELRSSRMRIAEVGRFWAATILPHGGTTPYSYYMDTSDLPPGLAYQGEPLLVGLSGTPAASGSYTFTLEVTDAAGETVDAAFTIHVVDEVDISGTWLYTMTVTSVSGDCGEQVGVSHTHTLTVTQNGTDLTFAGFFGEPTAQLTGALWVGPYDAEVDGSYPEDGGTTTGQHSLRIYSPTEMAGTELWSWTGNGLSCTNSWADITATRIGD